MAAVEPVTSDDSEDAALSASLTLSRITGSGPVLQATLLQHFGTADQVLKQSAATLQQVSGVGVQLANRIAENSNTFLPGKHCSAARNWEFICCRNGRPIIHRL